MEIIKAKPPENRWVALSMTLEVDDSFILNTLAESISAYVNLRHHGIHVARRSLGNGKYQVYVKRIERQ